MIKTREEAIKQCEDFIENHSEWSVEVEWANGVEFVLEDYKRFLKQKPRKGHWISHGEHCENLGVMPSGLSAYEWCSNCDCGIDVREWYRNHYNYCPNCGADMREVEE